MQNHPPLEPFHLFDRLTNRISRILRVVHAPDRCVESRIEFQNIVVYAQQGPPHVVAVELRGVRQHGDFGPGAQGVAQGKGVADDGLEVGMEGRLSVARESNDVGGVPSATIRRRVASSWVRTSSRSLKRRAPGCSAFQPHSQ